MKNNNKSKYYYIMKEAICFWEDEEVAKLSNKEEADKIAEILNNTTNDTYYVIEW
jgi:Txe/YoeB family toxin of Txe-Axe toxin-antitoxin module